MGASLYVPLKMCRQAGVLTMDDSLFAENEVPLNAAEMAKQAAWVMKLRSEGVRNQKVLSALEAIPRRIF